MASVSLSKILKYRKRVQNAIAKVSNDITSFNVVSADEGKEPVREVDVNSLMSRREKLVNHLIDLESRLQAANQSIQTKIVRLRELKGEIAFLRRIPTNHGPNTHYGDGPRSVSHATFRKKDVDERVRKAELEIDTIQDELDAFNATTKIEIPDFGLANQ